MAQCHSPAQDRTRPLWMQFREFCPERPVSGRECRGQVSTLEGHAGGPEPVEQPIAHRLDGRDLAGDVGVVVEREAERRLGQHLGGLVVAGVAAGDPGVDLLARRPRRRSRRGTTTSPGAPRPGRHRAGAACPAGCAPVRPGPRARGRPSRPRRRPRRTAGSWCRRSGSSGTSGRTPGAQRRCASPRPGRSSAAAAASSRAPGRGAACRRPTRDDRPSGRGSDCHGGRRGASASASVATARSGPSGRCRRTPCCWCARRRAA